MTRLVTTMACIGRLSYIFHFNHPSFHVHSPPPPPPPPPPLPPPPLPPHTHTHTQVPLTILSLHGSGTEEEAEAARRSMEAAASQGRWLLLHNVHTCPPLLSQLPTLLRELPSRQQEGWKLWLSACVREEEDSVRPRLLPVSLLQSACKVVLDPPKVS